MSHRFVYLALASSLLIGDLAAVAAPAAGISSTSAKAETPLIPTPPDRVAADRGVWAYIDGQPRWMDIDEARSAGMTIVDLSDDWVPYLFWSETPGQKDYKPNAYLDNYIDLANDRVDLDGARLKPREHNYLEVFGIPPTLSVLRRRFLEDEHKRCPAAAMAVLHEYYGPVRANDEGSTRRLVAAYHRARAAYREAQRETRIRSLDKLLRHPRYGKVALQYQRMRWRVSAIKAMQQRLVCEGLLGGRHGRFTSGEVNWNVVNALKMFERKHDIFGWGMLFEETTNALGRTQLENDYQSLVRLIEARTISAAGILEDGTSTASYRGADGVQRHVRDLVSEFREAAVRQLGLTDTTRALAFMRDHREGDFRRLLVAVQLPALPDYYSPRMDLSTVIDRGDVWYDLPFDDKGKRLPQPRRKLPVLTLFVKYNGQQIPLVHWRTTIGGWQKEMRGNEEYYKYKISDVGKRVWRHVVAGPVWVPPQATPATDMTKVRGRERVVSQSSFGPGYASAYGLVAGFHVTEAGYDNQIRTHGTVNYMSVRAGFSHGCHRLRNQNAVRMFSFVLRHRAFKRKGQIKLAHTHRFEYLGEEYQINLHTRGYYYELTPPIPVDVLEGNVRGKLKEPVADYVKKPSQVYQEDLPGSRARHDGPTAAPRNQPASDPMKQHQTL